MMSRSEGASVCHLNAALDGTETGSVVFNTLVAFPNVRPQSSTTTEFGYTASTYTSREHLRHKFWHGRENLTNGSPKIWPFWAPLARTSQKSVVFLIVLPYIRTFSLPRRSVRVLVVRAHFATSEYDTGYTTHSAAAVQVRRRTIAHATSIQASEAMICSFSTASIYHPARWPGRK